MSLELSISEEDSLVQNRLLVEEKSFFRLYERWNQYLQAVHDKQTFTDAYELLQLGMCDWELTTKRYENLTKLFEKEITEYESERLTLDSELGSLKRSIAQLKEDISKSRKGS